MTPDEALARLRQFNIGGWMPSRWELGFNAFGDCVVALHVQFPFDRRHGAPLWIRTSRTCDPRRLASMSDLYRMARTMFVQLLEHELDEHLRYAHEQVSDPHAYDQRPVWERRPDVLDAPPPQLSLDGVNL